MGITGHTFFRSTETELRIRGLSGTTTMAELRIGVLIVLTEVVLVLMLKLAHFVLVFFV